MTQQSKTSVPRFPWLSCASTIALSLGAVSEAANAQSLPRAEVVGEAAPVLTERSAEDDLDRGSNAVSNEGPSSRSTFGPRAPSFELEANEEGTLATFSLGLGATNAEPSDKKPGFYKISRTNLSVKGSFPISDDKDGETSFNFGRLGNFEKIEFSLTYYSSNIGVGQGNSAIFLSASRNCIASELQNQIKENPSSANEVSAFQRAMQNIYNSGNPFSYYFDGQLEEGEQNPLSDFPDLTKKIDKACVSGVSDQITFVNVHLGSEAKQRFLDSTFDRRPVFLAGVNGNVGRQSYKFINESAFLEIEEDRTPWSLNAFAGLIGSDYGWALRGQYTYLSEFSASEERPVCRPSTTSVGGQECLTGPVGAPAKNETSVGSIEFRKLFRPMVGSQGFPIGIAPQFTYDFESNEFGIDVPVYLSRNEAGKLTGGIRFGYRSDLDDVGVGIFIGAPLQIPF